MMPSGAPRDASHGGKRCSSAVDQQIAERREAADREQQQRCGDHQLAAKAGKSRQQQHGADHADADQEIDRQQHDAERLGEHEKQRKPLRSSATASYAAAETSNQKPHVT